MVNPNPNPEINKIPLPEQGTDAELQQIPENQEHAELSVENASEPEKSESDAKPAETEAELEKTRAALTEEQSAPTGEEQTESFEAIEAGVGEILINNEVDITNSGKTKVQQAEINRLSVQKTLENKLNSGTQV